ncbi:MAG: protein disulfide oxidoreductase [Rhodocyclaceae bacterium]|nr:protein disulfide oxidoreductase [Rhodocyclaceae bacterium]
MRRGGSWLVQAALLIAVLLAVSAWQTRGVPEGRAPSFVAASATGGSIDLEAWRAARPGQPVLIYFWAEWCPICRVVAAHVDGLSADWPVLTVAMQSGPPQAVARVLAERGHEWETVVDADGALARQYGFFGVPAYVILDAQGRIRFSSVGVFSETATRLRLWWLANRS